MDVSPFRFPEVDISIAVSVVTFPEYIALPVELSLVRTVKRVFMLIMWEKNIYENVYLKMC